MEAVRQSDGGEGGGRSKSALLCVLENGGISDKLGITGKQVEELVKMMVKFKGDGCCTGGVACFLDHVPPPGMKASKSVCVFSMSVPPNVYQ